MKLIHRLKMVFHAGPQFILAEPGTDPLDEPDQYRRRRNRSRGSLLWWALALAVLAASAWAMWGWWSSRHV